MPQKFQKLKKTHHFKKSSARWLLRQFNDDYVHRAKQEGWRCRAAFKIIEIDEKYKIFRKNKIVLDLGSAPGGWSQYAVQKVGKGNVLAVDLLEMPEISGVNFMQLDFLDEHSLEKITSKLSAMRLKNGVSKCDILLSDMAANSSGERELDHLRIINLLEEALDLAEKILTWGGCFVGKIFQGGSSDLILQKLRQNFSEIHYFKPKSSRQDSRETYLVALNFRKDAKANDLLKKPICV